MPLSDFSGHIQENTGRKYDHLKFRIHLVESLLLNYSVQYSSGHHGSDTTIQRLTELHFPTGIPPTEKMSETIWESEVSSRHDIRRDWILLIGLLCFCIRLCVYVCVCVCVFQGLPWKHYWGNITCIFTIYGLQETTVPSFIQIYKKYGNYFRSKCNLQCVFTDSLHCQVFLVSIFN